MRKIHCPACKQSDEGMTLVQPIVVCIDLAPDGTQLGGADYANELTGHSLTCPSCGHNWRTSRAFSIQVDVR